MNVVGKSGSVVHVSAYISITTVKRQRLANILHYYPFTQRSGYRKINFMPQLLFGIEDQKKLGQDR